MNPENLDAAFRLRAERNDICEARAGFKHRAIWVPDRVRDRFDALLDEALEEIKAEVSKL